jgi:putative heme iron utilization protein
MERKSDFDAKAAAKKLLREGRSGALATLMAGAGDPYCSLVNVATAADGAPLLLLSRLALHTRNILADARVSLMIDERKPGDPLEDARVMLMGRAVATDDPEARRRYLDRQPEAEAFAGFGDFSLYRVALTRAHLVAGFGRIVDLAASDILIDLAGLEALVKSEADVVAHVNRDHRDSARLFATKLLGAADGNWRCAGCDPEGLELQHGRLALRLPFPRLIDSPEMLRQLLKQLADRARAA